MFFHRGKVKFIFKGFGQNDIFAGIQISNIQILVKLENKGYPRIKTISNKILFTWE